MIIERVGGTLAFSREPVFDLLADIERYPQFVPGWISARIQSRASNIYHVEQVVGFGPVRLQFVSRALLQRPERIEITSTDPEFRKYSLTWVVAAVPAGCRIRVAAELELRSRLLQLGVNRFFAATVDEILAAFEARAHALYGGPATPLSAPHV